MPESVVAALALLAIYMLDIAAIALAVARKRDTASIVSWVLTILFLPGAGALLFFLFGLNRVPRRLKRIMARRETLPEVVRGASTQTFDDENEGGRAGWEGLCLMAEKCGAPPVRGGNAVTLLADGGEAFDAIFAAVREAGRHVHVLEYIFRDDRLGHELLDLMIEKARQGVEVRLLVDAIGTLGSWKLIRRLKAAGGQGAVFMPLLPYGKVFMPNLRNHRKIIVCDGQTGFLGGMNVGEEYSSRRFRRRHWQDAHIRIRGPAVHDLQRVFMGDWDFATGKHPEGEVYYPPVKPSGQSRTQIVASGPDEEHNSLHQLFFAAITRARYKLRIATPYLVPDTGLRDALKVAARRGVEVTVLTQGRPPDHWPTYWCSRYFWAELIEAGVRIYEYQAGVMHAKVLIADDHWSAIGSANLDNRSLRLNFEVMAVLDSDPDAVAANRRFDEELNKATPVTLQQLEHSPWQELMLQGLFRLFAPLL